jgi:hypothetical protein
VLPYDPTRGCYWGKCAFCHYGLAECGTARYRERPVEQAAGHIRLLADRYGCRLFHFSQDSLSPKTARRLAEALKATLGPALGGQPPVRWATDMRPEPALDPECCRVLAEGGALGMALGVESAAPRVLKLIHKGLSVWDAALAVKNLAAAGIAVEVMCFTDFPTETGREALMTARFIEELRESIALFICGEFDLVAGARVAQHPGEYGIRETWHVAGDEFSTTLFYEESAPSKTPADREGIDDAVDRLARSWWLHRYPWPVRSPRRTPCSGMTGMGLMCSGALRGRGRNPLNPAPGNGAFPRGATSSRSGSVPGSMKRRSGGSW